MKSKNAIKLPRNTAPRDGSWFVAWFPQTEMTNASNRQVYFDILVGEFYDKYGQLVRRFENWTPITSPQRRGEAFANLLDHGTP